jgi:hypothetical protein
MPFVSDVQHGPATSDLLCQHADRYQRVIARMADSSLKIKSLTATAVGVLVPVAAGRKEPALLLVAALLVLGLAFLDAYYLSVERAVRAEADSLVARIARDEADWRELFVISMPVHPTAATEVWTSLTSPATLLFYVLIAGLLVLGWVLA